MLWIQAEYSKIAFNNFFQSNIKDFLFLTQFAIACPLWTVACHCQLPLLSIHFSPLFHVDLVTQYSIYPKYSVLNPAISQIKNDIFWTTLTASEHSHPLQMKFQPFIALQHIWGQEKILGSHSSGGYSSANSSIITFLGLTNTKYRIQRCPKKSHCILANLSMFK